MAGVIVTAVLAAVGALLMLELVHRALLRLGRRSMLLGELARQAHRPAQAVVVLAALQLAIRQATTSGDWRPTVLHALWLGLIAAGAWLVAALLVVLEDVALSRYRTDVQDNRHARKVHTQIMVVRRVTIAAVALVAIGSMLVTFPAARAAGADALRAELDRVLAGTELWDGRVGVLQVTDAVGALVRVRALVSAVDAPTLWDLRCFVREALVGWLQEHHPGALPRIRTEVGSSEHTAAGPGPDDDARVFGGSPDGRQRSEIFAGSGEEPPPGPTG